MVKPTDIKERAFNFGIKIIKIVQSLPKNTLGFALGDQIIRSGTAIGALIEEATSGTSYKDFINIMRMARKEAKETHYWIRLISASDLLPENKTEALLQECSEIIRILVTSIKTAETKFKHKTSYS